MQVKFCSVILLFCTVIDRWPPVILCTAVVLLCDVGHAVDLAVGHALGHALCSQCSADQFLQLQD